jgi:hypothetical protein
MSGVIQNPTKGALERFQCTAAEWCALRDIGHAMVRLGASPDATPLRAYSHQRNAALNHRRIGWELSLMQWWSIWTESGHWHERGLGRGYQMCRKGDIGPYAVGNVFIAPGAENLSAATKKSDLPIGVARTTKSKRKPYRAICWVDGAQRHLGCYATADEAHEAYLAAVEVDLALRSPTPMQRAA